MEKLGNGIFDTARSAFLLALGLVGTMTFFLGLMKVAEAAGLLAILARLIRPLMIRLFPDVPPDHPAMGAMILNLSANALGLGNAATPFGIRAMQELEKLNRHPGVASNPMALFLAINTASVTLLPTDPIAWRASLGSTNPAGILPTTLCASLFATTMAVLVCKALQRFWAEPPGGREIPPQETEVVSPPYPGWVSAIAIGAMLLGVPAAVVYGKVIAPWVVPVLTVGLVAYAGARGVAVYEAFVAGAREGVDVALRIVPYLVATLVAVNVLTTSGVMGMFTGLIGPFTATFGLPAEALPMALLRSLSGSGASGMMVGIMRDHGVDSYVGYLVSTIQGSSETTFYVLAVYFGAVGVKDMRHTLAVGLIADAIGIFAAIAAVQAYFAYSGLPVR